ncbi:MAG: DUF763 domain-containing protein [Salinibacter sp.]
MTQLEQAYERQPESYEELVGMDGIGPTSLRALALIAELVHDATTARDDPAKFSFAHGGKDGTPEQSQASTSDPRFTGYRREGHRVSRQARRWQRTPGGRASK